MTMIKTSIMKFHLLLLLPADVPAYAPASPSQQHALLEASDTLRTVNDRQQAQLAMSPRALDSLLQSRDLQHVLGLLRLTAVRTVMTVSRLRLLLLLLSSSGIPNSLMVLQTIPTSLSIPHLLEICPVGSQLFPQTIDSPLGPSQIQRREISLIDVVGRM